jgi:hypothetical protein
MKFTYKLNSPDQLEATMTITMRVSEWKQLKGAVAQHYPGWQFSSAIGALISKAEQTLHSEEEAES